MVSPSDALASGESATNNGCKIKPFVPLHTKQEKDFLALLFVLGETRVLQSQTQGKLSKETM